MADDNPLVVFAGSYGSETDAQADFDTIKDAHHEGLIGKYQSALFTKEADGKVKVLDTDSTTRSKGAKWGTLTGAVVGVLFPPSILVGAAVGAGAGALTGNLVKGWGHKDIKELGEALDAGQSGVVLVAEATPDVAAKRILKKAEKAEQKEITEEYKEMRRALDD